MNGSVLCLGKAALSRALMLLCVTVLWTHCVHAAQTTSISSLEGFIDGIMEQGVVRGETAGAVVALVQDGRLLVARGYGMADVANAVPVQARLTTFRVGSITKVLTWIAILQQVEAGKLDLDADIQTYLDDIQLPEDYADPMTLRHLMTHSAGFEEDLTELFVGGPRQLHSLRQTLQDTMPERVRLPGTLVAYSNYGAALAGHIVAEVTGSSWHDYVAQHILDPLRMTNTSTRQPLPEALEGQRSKGFVKTHRGLREQNFSYIPLEPAGSASATAQDIARLMSELLNPNDTAVLTAKSKALLMGGAYVPSAKVNGMTLGMYEMSSGVHRAVGHDGSTLIFHSRMIMWPQQNLGVFVAVNTDTGLPLLGHLTDTLVKRLALGGWPAQYQPVTMGDRYTGEYISARRNFSGFTRILGLVDVVSVTYDRVPDLLRVTDMTGEHEFRQIEEHVFQQVDGNARIVFGRFSGAGNELSGSGAPDTLYHSQRPMLGYERAVGLESPGSNLLVLGVWMALAASVVLGWPISSLSRIGQMSTPGALLTGIVFLSIGVMLFFGWQVAQSSSELVKFMTHGIKTMPQLLWYPAGFCLVVLLQLGFLYRVWLGNLWWPLRRLHFTLMLAANCMLVWWLWYWRLLPAALLEVVG